jgi:hypothetical protein
MARKHSVEQAVMALKEVEPAHACGIGVQIGNFGTDVLPMEELTRGRGVELGPRKGRKFRLHQNLTGATGKKSPQTRRAETMQGSMEETWNSF